MTHDDSGLGELISTTFAAEGANIAINYFNRHAPAQAVQKACIAQGVKAVTIQAVRGQPTLFYLETNRLLLSAADFCG